MDVQQLRHIARYVVNAAALVLAIFGLPEFVTLTPEAWLPTIASVTAVLNTLLSLARRVE